MCQKPGRFDHFPEETRCMSWFFRMSAGTKYNCAFRNSVPNSKKIKKKEDLAFFKGYIRTINDLKWLQSAETFKFLTNATFLRLNSTNCK